MLSWVFSTERSNSVRRIAFIGSRDGINPEAVRRYIQKLIPERCVIITGGHHAVDVDTLDEERVEIYKIHPTKGVDAAAYDAAVEFGHIPVLVMACWQRDGKSAGHVRNPTIIDLADRVVAFWDGRSKGTAGGIYYANKIGRPISIYRPGNKI